MNNEQKRFIIDLLNTEYDNVKDGIALTDDNRTVEQELEFIKTLLADPDLMPETCQAAYMRDDFGTDCELEPGHEGSHKGNNPYGGPGYVEWEGGGFCAGDPLPYRNVKWHSTTKDLITKQD